jgi:hypothetical protein
MKVIDELYLSYGMFENKFNQSIVQNKKLIGDAQVWMDKAKHSLDEYTQKTEENPQFIAYDMLDCHN